MDLDVSITAHTFSWHAWLGAVSLIMMTSSKGKKYPRYWPLVPGIHRSQRPVKPSFDVFFDLRLNIRLSKQSWDWWFETPSRPLLRHCNDDVQICCSDIEVLFKLSELRTVPVTLISCRIPNCDSWTLSILMYAKFYVSYFITCVSAGRHQVVRIQFVNKSSRYVWNQSLFFLHCFDISEGWLVLLFIDLRSAQVYCVAIFLVSQEVSLNFHRCCG